MEFEDCREGLYVLDKTNALKGVITAVNPMGMCVFIREDGNGKGYVYHGDTMLATYSICNLEEIKGEKQSMKITHKYLERMRNSQHVHEKIKELCELYGFNIQQLHVFLLNDGTIRLHPLWTYGKAQSKCHPDDKFDINKGLELAFARLAEKLGVSSKWKPKEGEGYFYVFEKNGLVTNRYNHSWNLEGEVAIALGNCFKTRKEAKKHSAEIIERYQKLIAYAKELNK